MNTTDTVTTEEVAHEMRAAMRRVADEEITLLIQNRLIPWERRIEKLEREVAKLRQGR
jgi:hypothetical protein